nr:adenosylcobalamin-dependent ribonucleoside-diphosphate reductase [Armatimonadota bacterium]
TLGYFGGDELAASTFTSKYALKRQIAGEFRYSERTPADMHDRMAHEFARVDQNYPNPEGPEVYRQLMDRFQRVVPQGSPMYGIGNPYVRVSISNCVVVESPKDNISGIMETGKDLANLFKRRCGVGLDISSLRPDGAPVSNAAGTSTGAWSFADYFSHVCRMIGQNGRRGALMISMDVRHPDIERFVTMKRDLTKVTGANVSVMLTDDFMEAVDADAEWVCRWPIESGPDEATFTHRIQARDLWRLINESAVQCAEPGLLFWDNYGKNLPANYYPEFKSVCVNPCSEIALSPYDSCRLISQNLKGFVRNPFTPEACFDFEKFEETTRLAMRMMDNMVDLEIEYLTKIIDGVDEPEEKELWSKLRGAAVRGRRTGLGCHALGDALACLCLRYDSEEALTTVDRIFETFRNSAYDESVNLAIERGAFPAFDWDQEKDCAFIKRLPQRLQERIAEHGRRNISLLTMAPTGSVSILCQTSSGIEPVFMNFYTRRKKVNPSDPDARVDFTDQNGDRWGEFPVFHHNVMDYLHSNSEAMARWKQIEGTVDKQQWAAAISELLPNYFVTSMEIDPRRRVEIQGVIQKYIDHGISSTINMPVGTTIEQGQELYHMAWRHGLKGVTIYVDGSRTGVLVSSSGETKKKEAPVDKSKKTEEAALAPAAAASPAPVFLGGTRSLIEPRPRKLTGSTYKIQTPVGEAYVTINGTEEGAFEVFVNIAKAGSTVAADAEAIGRLCSLALRMPSSYPRLEVVRQIVRQLEGIGGERSAGLGKQRVRSIADAVAQVLNEHCGFSTGLPAYSNGHGSNGNGNGHHEVATSVDAAIQAPSNGHSDLPVGDLCPSCGHASYIAEAGCHTCHSCGFSEC